MTYRVSDKAGLEWSLEFPFLVSFQIMLMLTGLGNHTLRTTASGNERSKEDFELEKKSDQI